ncbi:MAG: ISKra4 family transposase [Candidatus Omnitrophica bacterium]|nr:ISKra4 family transposase [Candidatus Omnitrophota bacterium]
MSKPSRKLFLKPKLKTVFLKCDCSKEARHQCNGSKQRNLITLDGRLNLKWPKALCRTCGHAGLLSETNLIPEAQISAPLEKLILELAPLAVSYEAESQILWKTRSISISAKEIERIVLRRGLQIGRLQSQELEQMDKILVQHPPQAPKCLYLGADGMYVQSAEGKGKRFEGKFGIVFTDERAEVSKNRFELLNKRCVASFRGKEDFSELLQVAAYRMGVDQAKEVFFFADGERCLWDIKKEYFPQAIGILDWNHISRNLSKALRIIADRKQRDEIRQKLSEFLWRGDSQQTLAELSKLIVKEQKSLSPEREQKLKELKDFKTYIQNNQEWIVDYESYQQRGYYIGSSIVESTVNHLGAFRLKKKRARQWIRQGADSMARLITVIKNRELDHYWKQICLN